jgi:hypothetical protein
MRTLTFEMLPGTGPGSTTMRGSVVDLLVHIPYLLMPGMVPSLGPLNDLLRRGLSEAGMSGGCRWEPFELGAEEWAEVRDALTATGSRYVEPPDWVADYEDWFAWLFDTLYGVPAQEHRRLMRDDAELERAIARAAAEDDQDAVLDLHLQRIRVGEQLATLVTTHLRRAR